MDELAEPQHYSFYGLTVASALECPGLPRRAATPAPDVRVCYAPVAAPADGRCFEGSAERFVLHVADVATFLIEGGRRIAICLADGADHDELRLYLYGAAFGVLLHQRGRLPLHGSAVATARGAVICVAPSGHGKSTLAAALALRGWCLLADDVSSLDTSGPTPLLAPAHPCVLLCEPAVERLALGAEPLAAVRKQVPKLGWSVEDRFAAHPAPVRTVYELVPADVDAVTVTEVCGAEKLRVLADHTYGRAFLMAMGQGPRHFAQLGAVARAVRVARITRPCASFALEALVDALEADLDRLPGSLS